MDTQGIESKNPELKKYIFSLISFDLSFNFISNYILKKKNFFTIEKTKYKI